MRLIQNENLFMLATTLSLLSACGGGGGVTTTCTATSGQTAKYVTKKITLPQNTKDFSFDLVGDGSQKNALGNLIATLRGAGVTTQNSVDASLATGELSVLFEQHADNLSSSSCSQLDLKLGEKPSTPPTYNGTDSYVVDQTVAGGTFKGEIKSNQFSSAQPATTREPVTIPLRIPLLPGFAPLDLKIYGAHLQFRRSGETLVAGEIHGALKIRDLTDVTLPAVVKLLNERIAAEVQQNGMPSKASTDVLDAFDNGGANQNCDGNCKNPDNSCGVKGNKILEVCEVTSTGIVGGSLRPDMKLFDANGNYLPQPGAAMKDYDAFSFGIGFESVKAVF